MKEIVGKLHGYFETGLEGTCPAIMEQGHITLNNYSLAGLYLIEPGDHLTIIKNDKEVFNGIIEAVVATGSHDGLSFINEPDLSAGWMRYPLNKEAGQLYINTYWVHYIPTNIDLRLWWDVFFNNPYQYNGILKIVE